MTTDGLTTTESLSSAVITGSLTSISSHFAVILRPPASDTVGDSILAITNLPSLSVEQTATSSDSTAISSGVTGSPAAILLAETFSASQNANLPSTTYPEPLTEMDSTATDNTLSSSTTRLAFARIQLTVAGLPLLATSPATVFTALAADAYKSVLDAQRKVRLALRSSAHAVCMLTTAWLLTGDRCIHPHR